MTPCRMESMRNLYDGIFQNNGFFISTTVRKSILVFYVRDVSGKLRYITCRPIGQFFMLIMAALPSTLILYL